MGRQRSSRNDDHVRREGTRRAFLLERTGEVLERLIDLNGFYAGSRNDFALDLAARYGRVWMTMAGKPNRQLVVEVLALLKDYDAASDPEAWDLFGGYRVGYGAREGGITLVGSLGEMKLEHLIHLGSGDVLQQTNITKILRRRQSVWESAAKQCNRSGDFEFGAVLTKMEDQIDRQGFVTESTLDDFYRLANERGIEVQR